MFYFITFGILIESTLMVNFSKGAQEFLECVCFKDSKNPKRTNNKWSTMSNVTALCDEMIISNLFYNIDKTIIFLIFNFSES